ncbi:ArsR/SmtB family transcription factor [Mesorhizobium xinjiangense]|uniref:ArsR/SmtB family transcription factor n=1 Tax=Mesorhizobium xinjiangense TaxID=2678685 RepID=UPI001F376754|nr:metalloregulator ArsR/SmtB family transcription factor [Mesorhizobium xinjiangense]
MAAIEISRMAESAERAAELLSVLANKNRLLVLCNLLEGEMAVQPLAEAVGMSQSALSQQLAKLRALRIVTTRRDGREIYYSVASQETRTILETLYAIYCAPAEEAGDVRAAVAAA